MRRQIYISRGWRGVWHEAEQVARSDGNTLSGLVSRALRDYLDARRRRLAKQQKGSA